MKTVEVDNKKEEEDGNEDKEEERTDYSLSANTSPVEAMPVVVLEKKLMTVAAPSNHHKLLVDIDSELLWHDQVKAQTMSPNLNSLF